MAIIPTSAKLLPRDSTDHYRTPYPLALSMYKTMNPAFKPKTIIDPGAGTGVFGKAGREVYPMATIVGIERYGKRSVSYYDVWRKFNFMDVPVEDMGGADLIIGNPPYGDVWSIQQSRLKREMLLKGEKWIETPRPSSEPMADAEAFIRKALELLRPKGYLVYLLRLSFLASQGRGNGLWREYPPQEIRVLKKRVSFYDNNRTDDTEYGVYIWQKGIKSKPQLAWHDW